MRSILAAAALTAASTAAALAGTITGTASVIDGDTIEIHGQRIRLHAIDAPEGSQYCLRNGERWRCGRDAAFALDGKIGGRTVSCEQKDVDRYGRIVAVCYADGIDVNGWLVQNGWAVAYRRYGNDYSEEEGEAGRAKAGVWSGPFITPERWRRGQRFKSE